jgi:hypothetical protein
MNYQDPKVLEAMLDDAISKLPPEARAELNKIKHKAVGIAKNQEYGNDAAGFANRMADVHKLQNEFMKKHGSSDNK